MQRLLTAISLAALCAAPAPAQNQGIILSNSAGADNHIDIPYDSGLVPASGITVEAWITYDDTSLPTGSYRWPTVVRQNPTPQSESYMLRVDASNVNNRNLRWLVRTQGGVVAVDWQFAPQALTTWTHIAGTYDGAIARLFVGAQQVNQGVGSGPIVDQGGVLRIGNGDTAVAGAEVWNGEIDELRLWPYARTAGEIAATMDLELAGLPAGASSWNLNGDFQDSSSTRHGTMTGTVPFNNPNNLVLQSFPSAGVAPFGQGTPGCGATPEIGLGALPRVATADFALYCIHAPASRPGLLYLSPGALASPIQILGLQIWVDILDPAAFPLAPASGPQGTARAALPIPAMPSLALTSLAAQFFWADPTCTTSPLSASAGLNILILP